jgi:PAS domain S-box-containing protein/diguanylate cyclase (GGDEF)-like protein
LASKQGAAGPALVWLFAGTVTVLSVYALDIFVGVLPADLSELFKRFAIPVVFFGAAGQCALRARGAQGRASAWWLFSLALVTWGGGSLYYGAVLWRAGAVPIPSPADGLWIVFYGFAYAALFQLLRSGGGAVPARLKLDAAISALGTAAVLGAVTLPSVLGQTHESSLGFLTIAAYPVGDLGLLAAVVAVMSVIGLRGSGAWRLIALAFAVFVAADSVYLVEVARGTYLPGGLIDLGWPLAAILLGAGAGRPGVPSPPDLTSEPKVALPVASGLLALALLTYDHFWRLEVAAVGLATGPIILVLLRLLQVVRSNTRLLGVLTRSEVRLRKAEEMVGGGSWEIPLDGQTMTWSDGFLRMHGLKSGAHLDREAYLAIIHPEDRQLVLDAVAECLKSGRGAAEYRVIRPDGAKRTVRAEGEIVEPADGERYLRGGVLDVTDERAGFDAAPIGMSVAGPEHHELLRVNNALCSILGRPREQLLGMRISELAHPDDRASSVANYRSLVDGVTTSYQSEKRYLRPDGGVVWAEIHVTPVYDGDGSLRAFSSQVIDTTDRKNSLAATESARLEVLRRLAITSQYRDNETHEHTERVGRMAEEIGRSLGLESSQLALLRLAAPLHDIGKIGVADAILLKPGPLTASERQAMERHTLIGADVLSESGSEALRMAEEIAVAHHEKWDGTGYPHGLKGEAIPLVGRIVAIADVFDALTHARPYKEAWSVGRTVAHISGESGAHFDPKLVDVFTHLDHAGLASWERERELEASVGGGQAPSRPVRARAILTPDADDGQNRDHAAAHRDEIATERDAAAAERDHVAASADDGILLRDDAASARDRDRHARDAAAGKRDQSEARADGHIDLRDDAACDRDGAATTRDQNAAARDQNATELELTEGAIRPNAASAFRTSNREQAVEDRGLAAADRGHTASERNDIHEEASDRKLNRRDAADDRRKASADRALTADDRERSEEGAGLRGADRADAETDRALAADDRDKATADRVASMTEHARSRNELRRAHIDQLTGAMGRQFGLSALHSAVERASRDGAALTIAHIRVGGLSQVNDREGQSAGDALLREVVGAMQVHFHDDDPIVRMSGDHFLCAVQGSEADARSRVAGAEKTIEHYHHGASINVTMAALRPGETLWQLANRADRPARRSEVGP